MDEDWAILASLLPSGWRDLARSTGAVRRLRGFGSVDDLLRSLLLHVGRGLSLRDTAAMASASGLAQVSDVAMMKRFRAAAPWFHALCRQMVAGRLAEGGCLDEAENAERLAAAQGYSMHLVDATHVAEPGRTGSHWRLHYALAFPGLACRHVDLGPVVGAGTSEGFERFPAAPGICLIGDRGYCKAGGIASVVDRGGDVLVRCQPRRLALRDPQGGPLDLDARLRAWPQDRLIDSWPCRIERTGNRPPAAPIEGRLILVKRSKASTAAAVARAKRKAVTNQAQIQEHTLLYAGWFMLFTTLPEEQFDAPACCAWYRLRWQIELAFKRLKSLAQLGHLPKHDQASVEAWLYGKLLAGLLAQALIRHSQALSPWGYPAHRLPTPARARQAAAS